MRYILSIFFTLFFASCFGVNQNIDLESSTLKYPNWYLNPPENSQILLFGTGVAKTKEEAILNALDDLSSRLMLTIESSQEISMKSFRDFREYINKTTVQKINTKSEKLSFKDYKIEDFYTTQNHIFYLISIKKSDLIKSLNSEISSLYEEFNTIKSNKDDILSKNFAYTKLLEKFYKNLNKAEILQGLLDKNSAENRYLATILELEKELSNNQKKVSFFITSDENSKIFENSIRDILSKKTYKISTKNENSDSYEINLSSNQSKVTPSGFYIIENILNIKLKNSQNKQISSKTISLKGASSNSFEDAKIDLVWKLKKFEEKESILPFD